MDWSIFSHMYMQLFQNHLLKDHLFCTELPLCLFKKSIVHICVDVLLKSLFYSIDLFLYAYAIPHWFITVVLYNKSWSWIVLVLQICSPFLFFKVILAILCPLHFHINFRIWLSVSTKILQEFWLRLYQISDQI